MSRLIRQLVSVTAISVLTVSAVYGSYQPLRKSILFRRAGESLGIIRTTSEFTVALSLPLEVSSPIGQEELVRETVPLVLALIQMNRATPAVTARLTDFVNRYFLPIYQRGKGVGFGQTLYRVGTLNVTAYLETGNQHYLNAGETLFLTGQRVSPRRPEFLYSLLQIYFITEDTEKVKRISDSILTQWPDDLSTKAAVAEYLAKHQ